MNEDTTNSVPTNNDAPIEGDIIPEQRGLERRALENVMEHNFFVIP